MKHIREVRVRDLWLYFYLPVLFLALLWVLYALLRTHGAPLWWSLGAAALLSYIPLRRALIGAVLLYKAYAPLSLRQSCLFEPTCSTYMILSIQKYGILLGVAKGLHRILRCHPPNGGVDYP